MKFQSFLPQMGLTSEARRANTSVARSVVNARGSIGANIGFARVQFVLTSNASVVHGAAAVETRTEILAFASMHTRTANAALGCGLTLFAIRSGGASKSITNP